MSARKFNNEWKFTQAVIELAKEYGWERPFHIPSGVYKDALDKGSIPAGFPDLLLRYRDSEGNSTLIVAELKTDDEENSNMSSEQRAFLEDFAQHVPTFVFRYRDWEYIERVLQDGPPDPTGQIIEPSPPIVRSKQWLPPERRITTIALQLKDDISDPSFPRGDLAGLRRMNPEVPDTAAFWQLMARRGLLDNPALESKWALVMHGIALMTPNTHNSEVPVGMALYEGGESGRKNAFYSNLRLNRLLKARGSLLVTLLTQMFRMMKAARQPFDWGEMASFILGEVDEPEKQEEARVKIARAYYRTEYRNSPERDA